MTNKEECSFSKLELFKRTKRYSKWEIPKDLSHQKPEDSGPIEFLTENATDHFLVLRLSYLIIMLKVVNSDGSNVAANAKTGLVNYPIAFLFQQVDVLVNGNLVSCSTNTYASQSHVGDSLMIL